MTDITTQKSIAIAELNPIMTDIAAFKGTIEAIDIVDDETQGQMGDFVKMMNARRKKLEDKRDSLVRPLNSVVKDINALFKAPRDQIDSLLAIAKKKMADFARAQMMIAEQKRKAEQEAAEKERREAQELAEAMREKIGDDAKEVADVVVEQAEKKVEQAAAPTKVKASRGQQSTVTVTKTWKAEVTNVLDLCKAVAEGRLPTTVIEPNMRALNDLSRDTKKEREVDGVRYYLHVNTQTR